MKNYRFVMLVLAGLLIVGACKKKEPKHEEGPMESAGEEIDEAGREVKEETNEALEDTGENVEEAGDTVEDKTDG